MNISVQVTKKESELIRKFAELNELTVSDVMRQAILSKIEDEFDIFLYEKAIEEKEENPKTYNIQETRELLDIE